METYHSGPKASDPVYVFACLWWLWCAQECAREGCETCAAACTYPHPCTSRGARVSELQPVFILTSVTPRSVVDGGPGNVVTATCARGQQRTFGENAYFCSFLTYVCWWGCNKTVCLRWSEFTSTRTEKFLLRRKGPFRWKWLCYHTFDQWGRFGS